MSEQTLQDKLRADAASGECREWANLTFIAAADRIDELERQLDHYKEAAKRTHADNKTLHSQLAEAQKDQADAKRYRWLRDDANAYDKAGPLVFLSGPRGEAYQIIHGQKLDDSLEYAIDSAMKVKP